MRPIDCGGNIIRALDLNQGGHQLLGCGPYDYSFYKTTASDHVDTRGLGSFTVYVLKLAPDGFVKVSGLDGSMSEGDALQVESCTADIEASGAELLLAGTLAQHKESMICLTPHHRI